MSSASDRIVTWHMTFPGPRAALRAACDLADFFTDHDDVDTWLIDVTDGCDRRLELGAALAYSTDDPRTGDFIDDANAVADGHSLRICDVAAHDPS